MKPMKVLIQCDNKTEADKSYGEARCEKEDININKAKQDPY